LRLIKTRTFKLARLAKSPEHWHSALKGVVPSVEHATVPFRPDLKTVLDIGASRGQFSLFAARRFPGSRIICFEPIPEAQKTLTAMLGSRADIRPVAVGAEPGVAELYISAQDDSSSLLPIGDRQVAEFPGTGLARTIEAPIVALRDVIAEGLEPPLLLKIDVQGLELEVLKGIGSGFDRIDEAFIECSFVELYEGQALADEVITYLLERGLRLAGIHGISYSLDGSALQADLFFRRK
jgi:FkbM family methyltransferase